jgi:hypothetical protein
MSEGADSGGLQQDVVRAQQRLRDFVERYTGRAEPQTSASELQQLRSDLECMQQWVPRETDTCATGFGRYAEILEQLRHLVQELELRLRVRRAELQSEEARLQATRRWILTARETL